VLSHLGWSGNGHGPHALGKLVGRCVYRSKEHKDLNYESKVTAFQSWACSNEAKDMELVGSGSFNKFLYEK